jgi:hypothetical protein
MNLKDMEECGHSLSVVLSWHLHVETEENHEKHQSGQLVFQLRSKPVVESKCKLHSYAFLCSVNLENFCSRLCLI